MIYVLLCVIILLQVWTLFVVSQKPPVSPEQPFPEPPEIPAVIAVTPEPKKKAKGKPRSMSQIREETEREWAKDAKK